MAMLTFESDAGIDDAEVATFGDSVSASLCQLQNDVPFGRWTLTRPIGDDWVMLHTAAPTPDGACTRVARSSEAICTRMTRDLEGALPCGDGESTRLSAPVRRTFDVGAYIGIALYEADGRPLGTIGSVDTRRRYPPRGRRHIEFLRSCGYRIVALIERERTLMRSARMTIHALLRQRGGNGAAWMDRRHWRHALSGEDQIRRLLALPAAVLAVTITERMAIRSSGTGSPLPATPSSQIDSVLSCLIGESFIGIQVRASTLMVLVPECDQRRAGRLEARARLLFDNSGLKVRCCAVAVRFDEPLSRAATTVLRKATA